MNAKKVGELIGKQDLVAIVFAGGLSELKYMQARQILVNDLHAKLYNLYHVVSSHPEKLIDILRQQIYHPQTLDDAKTALFDTDPVKAAAGYFIINWMTRCNGGVDDKKKGSGVLAMRWTASGGSSIARWKAAVDGLPEWADLLRSKCECTCLDWRHIRAKWNDRKGHAIYLDPPWIDGGEYYLHKFTPDDQYELACWANSLKYTTVVVRHSDHIGYRMNYRDEHWDWIPIDARNQHGNETGEYLIRNRAST